MALTTYLFSEDKSDQAFEDRLNDQIEGTTSGIEAGELNLISVVIDDSDITDAEEYYNSIGYSLLGTSSVELDGVHHWGKFTTANEPTLATEGDIGYDTTKQLEVIYTGTEWISHNEDVNSPFGGFGTLQNRLKYSSDFDNAVWGKSGANLPTVSPNDAIAPDGTMTADTVSFPGPSAGTIRQSNLGVSMGNTYTVSMWVRAVSGSGAIGIDIGDGANGNIVATSTWQRISVQRVAGSSDWLDVFAFAASTPTVVEFWGFQVSDGTDALPYVHTLSEALKDPQVGVTGADSLSIAKVFSTGSGVEFNESVKTPFGGFGKLQNYIERSQEFDNAYWTNGGANPPTVVGDNALAPDGTMTADTWTWPGPGAGSFFSEVLDVTNLDVLTISGWVKNANGGDDNFFNVNVGGTAGGGVQATITVTNEWQRVSVQVIVGDAGFPTLQVQNDDGEIYEFWGWQVNDGSETLPYTRTFGTALATATVGSSVNDELIVSDITSLGRFNINAAGEVGISSGGDLILQSATGDTAGINGMFIQESGNNRTVVFGPFQEDGNATIEFRDFAQTTKGVMQYNELSDIFSFSSTTQFQFATTNADSILFEQSGGTDADPIFSIVNAGTNGGASDIHLTDRDPIGNISANGGDLAIRADGEQSAMYIHKGTGAGASDWYKMSVNPENTVEIFNASDLDLNITGVVSTAAGVITVTGDLTLDFKQQIVTTSRFVLTAGCSLRLVGGTSTESNIVYVSTGTLFSGEGSLRIVSVNLISAATGTLFDLTNSLTAVTNMQNLALVGWDDLGTMTDGVLLIRFITFVDITSGIDFENCLAINSIGAGIADQVTVGPLFNVNSAASTASIIFGGIQAALASGQTLYNLSPLIPTTATITVKDTVDGGSGDLFKQATIANDVVNTVADGSPATVSNPDFIFSARGPEFTEVSEIAHGFFDNEIVTIAGTTNYNGTFRISLINANAFDIREAYVGDEIGVGTADSERLTLGVSVGHGIIADDNIGIVLSNYYNGFYNVLAVTATTVIVNGIFIDTDSCEITNDVSLDHSDSRVTAFLNKGFKNSKPIGSQHIEKNLIATSIGVADIYQDIDFTGSTGAITVAVSGGAGITTITSATHGLSDNQNVKIRNTTQYNGVFTVFNVTTNTFDINHTFGLTATGTWDSKMILDEAATLFRITDQDNGEMEFLGDTLDGQIFAAISAFKGGSTENYQFALAVNGVVPDGSPFGERDITTSLGSLSVLTGVTLVKGDLIKPQVSASGTTNSITIQAISMNVIGS